MNISASVVTFHTSHTDIMRLLECVSFSSINKLYVIDNSSNDELREFIKTNAPHNTVYIHSLNLGYGSGHNIAIRRSIEEGFDYHAVLNPDIFWEGDIIANISQYMEHHMECGLLMPKILYPNGEVQYLCKLLPTPADLLIRRFIPSAALQDKLNRKYELHWTNYDKIIQVPSLSGCFMFMRNLVLQQVGGFDERFFMYAEDLDLCRRIGEISRTIFYPNVCVFHEYDKGSYKNKKLLKYHIQSIIKYFNKWGWFFDSKRRKRNKYCTDLIKLNEP